MSTIITAVTATQVTPNITPKEIQIPISNQFISSLASTGNSESDIVDTESK